LEGNTYYAYPIPQNLVSTRIEEIRQRGLSLRKAEYIEEVSTLITQGKLNLKKLRNYKRAEKIIRELDKI